MKTPDQNFNVDEKFEFKAGAEKLYNLIIQSSGILELADDFRAVSSRTRVEVAATLLKELPDTNDEKMIEYRKKVLYECRQGIQGFKPKNEQDLKIKEEIIKVIDQLKAVTKQQDNNLTNQQKTMREQMPTSQETEKTPEELKKDAMYEIGRFASERHFRMDKSSTDVIVAGWESLDEEIKTLAIASFPDVALALLDAKINKK